MTPIVDRVFAGEAVQMDDLVLMPERHDQSEETHFSFSFTPVPDDAGAVAGIFCACTDADSDDRAQPFRHDGAQRSEMIAIRGGHPVNMVWMSVSKAAVNR